METIEQVDNDFNVKKPKKKGLIIGGIVLLIILIIAALILTYFFVLAKPQRIFNSYVDKLFATDSKEYDSVKMNAKMKVTVEAEDTSYQDILDEIEKCTLEIASEADFEQKEEIVSLGLEYDSAKVIDAQLYYNSENIYAYFDGIFDKYIKIDMNEEQKLALESIFENADSKEQMENSKKVMQILRDELKAGLEEEGTFEKESVTIDVGDKEEKATKTTLTLTEKELYNLIANICSNLAKNEDFLDYLEGLYGETPDESPKDLLEELADKIKSEEANSKNNIKISIYTKGILNNSLVGVDVEIYSAEDAQTITATILKEDEDVYSFNVEMKSSFIKVNLISGKLEIEKEKDSKDEQEGKATLTIEIAETGKVTLEMDYSLELNKGIDKVDISNSVNMDELTDEDMEAILEKLMERPLIGDFLKGTMYSVDSIIDNKQISSETTTSQNEVKSTAYGYSVTFSVPTGFVYDDEYTYDYSKYYDLDDNNSEIMARIYLSWYTDDEYIEDIEWDYDYYTDSKYYKNVSLGDLKTITVGDKEFKYQILTYESDSEYYSEKYQKAYVWYRLDDEYIFAVEFDSTDTEITEDIISGFLNISVEKIK